MSKHWCSRIDKISIPGCVSFHIRMEKRVCFENWALTSDSAVFITATATGFT